MELVRPDATYKESFIAAMREFQDDPDYARHGGDRYANMDCDALERDFDSYVRVQLGKAEGKHLPEGFVSETGYWLVDNGQYVGAVHIRHRLTDHLLKIGGHIGYDIRLSMRKRGYGTAILQLALPKARELGIDRALITCDETNAGSRKIIEANGGVLENSVPQGEGKPNKLRFWIDL